MVHGVLGVQLGGLLVGGEDVLGLHLGHQHSRLGLAEPGLRVIRIDLGHLLELG